MKRYPFTLTFSLKKDHFIFKTLTFDGSNRTLFLQNTDFHRVERTFEDFKGSLFGTICLELLNMEKIDLLFKKNANI